MSWRRVATIAALAATIAAGTLLAFVHSSGKADANDRIDRRVTALLAGVPQQGRTLGYDRRR